MERFQFDISQAFRRSGYDLESQADSSGTQLVFMRGKYFKFYNLEYSQEETGQTGSNRDPSMPSAVPENPMNSSHGAPTGRQTRYKDEHYERWSHRNKPKRSETMREKVILNARDFLYARNRNYDARNSIYRNSNIYIPTSVDLGYRASYDNYFAQK